jgi:hypothetical protein
MIERHHDVAADRLLRLDAHLRAQHDRASVDVALENRAFFTHRPRMRQREDLIAAGVVSTERSQLMNLWMPPTRRNTSTPGRSNK